MGLFSTGSPPYRRVEVDLNARNSAPTELVRLVGKDTRVLEVGPAWGYVTKALKSLGCQVTCIEQSQEMAAIARGYCDRMITGDIENLDLLETLGTKSFHVITFGDVLEHLRDPVVVLKRVRPLLVDGGFILASIPNVAHQSVRYALLLGEFPYADEGLLDRTHLRFFTRTTLEAMFKEAGYHITEMVRINNDTFSDEWSRRGASRFQRFARKALKRVLRSFLRGDPDALTWQFVVRAVPEHH